jgi:outer membrane protein TolC
MLPQSQQLIGTYSRVNLNPNMPVINQLVKSLPPGSVPLAFSNWLYGFNLSWELDLWGRIRRNIESSNAGLDASVEDYDSALGTLFADVATNYVQYLVNQQRIKIAKDNVRIQEGVLALAAERFQVGTTTRLDVERARTVLEQTRSTIPAFEILLGQANDTLCTLVGVPPRDLESDFGPGPPLGTSPMPSTLNWVAAGIPADLLRRRPDVRSAERQVAAQSAQIGVAEADLYPTIFINGTIGWDAEIFSQGRRAAESPLTLSRASRMSSGGFAPAAAGILMAAACLTGGTRIAFRERADPTTTAASRCPRCAGPFCPTLSAKRQITHPRCRHRLHHNRYSTA